MSLARVDTRCLSLGLAPTSRLYKISGFTLTNVAITSYTHKPWHRRYFLNREVPYWLQCSITGSAFRGFILILKKNSMLRNTKIFRSRMCALSTSIHATRLAQHRVIAQLVRQNRLDNRTSCNSFSPDFHMSGTFERHVTLYD